jgi:hypothetical protein
MRSRARAQCRSFDESDSAWPGDRTTATDDQQEPRSTVLLVDESSALPSFRNGGASLPLSRGRDSGAAALTEQSSRLLLCLKEASPRGRRLRNGLRQSSLRAPRRDTVYHDPVVAPRAERPAMLKRPVRSEFLATFGDFLPSVWLSRAELGPQASVYGTEGLGSNPDGRAPFESAMPRLQRDPG